MLALDISQLLTNSNLKRVIMRRSNFQTKLLYLAGLYELYYWRLQPFMQKNKNNIRFLARMRTYCTFLSNNEMLRVAVIGFRILDIAKTSCVDAMKLSMSHSQNQACDVLSLAYVAKTFDANCITSCSNHSERQNWLHSQKWIWEFTVTHIVGKKRVSYSSAYSWRPK